MEKSKKGIVVVLTLLLVICLLCGFLGLFQSKQNQKIKIEAPKEYVVNVLYYLDGTQVEQMPQNEFNESGVQKMLYSYDSENTTCTNNITFTWDEETWTFTPNKTADSTCRVYFLSNEINVSINVVGGTLKTTNTIAQRGEDYVVEIKPTSGFAYANTVCTNNEIATWNKETSKLTIASINKTVSCDVTFEKEKYSVEIKVNHGAGSVKIEDKEYGSSVTADVTATSGYSYDTAPTCTNSQTATWSDGVLKINKLTNNTVCTLTFKLTPVEPDTYDIKLVVGNHGKITSNNSREATQEITSGGTAYFTVDADEGYEIGSISCTGNATSSVSIGIITIANITSNQTCTVTINEKSS